MADLNEIVERLVRLEEKVDQQREDMEEVKASVKDMEKKVYVLWLVGTAGVGLLLQIIGQKAKSLFGGHT